ncbi:MAG: hypothetical protein F6K31_13795 [Symploca sp. SIO2G7]|nr:hypothetical protein [Symploca sp. SIO2G7]
MLESSSDNLPEQQYALASFHKLLQKHPLFFWGGLWAILMTIITVATIGLFDPGSIEEEPKSEPAPTQVEESPEPKSPKEQDWSLPLFSAVVLGCVGGSLLVTNALRRSAQRRRSSRRLKSSAIVHQPKGLLVKRRRIPAVRKSQPAASVKTQPNRTQNIQPNIQQNPQRPNIQQNFQRPNIQQNPQRPSIQQNFQRPNIQQNFQRPSIQQNPQRPSIQQNPQPNIPSDTQPTQVTVLSSEDNHPLDSKPESLAEMMDLRKRQSLKSLIRGK